MEWRERSGGTAFLCVSKDNLEERVRTVSEARTISESPPPTHTHTFSVPSSVPVEIGSRYTDDDWSQTLMTVSEFLEKYMCGEPDKGVCVCVFSFVGGRLGVRVRGCVSWGWVGNWLGGVRGHVSLPLSLSVCMCVCAGWLACLFSCGWVGGGAWRQHPHLQASLV